MYRLTSILKKELRPYLLAMGGVIVLIICSVAFEAFAPWPFKILIDNVLGDTPLDPSSPIENALLFLTSREALGFFTVILFFAASLFSSLFDYLVDISTKKLIRRIVQGFAEKTFQNLEQFAIGFFRKQQIGDYIYRLSYDTSALGDFLELGLFPLLVNTFYLVITLTILFVISPPLTLLALTMIPPLIIILAIFNKKIGKASKYSEQKNSSLFSFIEETLIQLKIIQAFNRQAGKFHEFKTREHNALSGELTLFGLGYLQNLLIGIVVAVGYSLVIAYGIHAVFLQEISTGLLVVFLFYLDNLTNPLMSIMGAASDLRENYVKVSRVREFYNPKFHVHDLGTMRDPMVNQEISFSRVTVKGDGGSTILHNATLHIPHNKITVIVGVSGSGKSTLISLILRFLEPSSGTLKIGTENISSYSIEYLRNCIAYVPQEIVLFNDTIRNNITFKDPSPSLAALKKASKLAVADTFIKRLPGGYDFMVGEEGLNLSGGQRQRLMLARAFLKTESKILIMDEPLSSLDVKTSTTLMQNIIAFSKNKTTIIISNVLSVISLADHVVVINEGKIIHQGKGRALVEQKKLAHLLKTS